MVTTPWCSEVTGSSRCSCGIYNCVKELCKLLLGEKNTFLHLLKKKPVFVRLQTQACPLLCILQLFYSLYWCSFKSLKPSLHSGCPPGSAQSEAEPRGQRHLPSFIFSKKNKKKSLWNFVFLVLSSPMTLLYNCGGRAEPEAHLDR